jgi:nitroreductase
MELEQAITTRKSCRNYVPFDIPQDHIDKIVAAGCLAPVAGGYKTLYVIDALPRTYNSKMVDLCYGQKWMIDGTLFVAGFFPQGKDFESFQSKYKDRALNFLVAGLGAATQNMTLTANDLGYGSCWVGAFDNDAVRKVAGFCVETILVVGKGAV